MARATVTTTVLDDIFSVQDDIAGMIAQTLTRRVGNASGPLVSSTTSHTEAYSLYFEGRYLWNKRPGDVVWQALDRFERAISIDPGFAPAHAALASVYGTLGAWEFGVLPPAEALAKAKAAATRALELDPQLAAGHTAMGYTTLHFDWNADGACREFDQAIALNPTWVDAHHWHSHALCAAARFPESLGACRRTVELDPLNPLMHAHVAWHHYMAKDFATALVQAERVVRMEPSFHWGYFCAGWALERLGRGAEAVAALQEAVRCSSSSPVMLAGLGHALAVLQDRRGALRVADELQRLRADKGLFAYELGIIHAALVTTITHSDGLIVRCTSDQAGLRIYEWTPGSTFCTLIRALTASAPTRRRKRKRSITRDRTFERLAERSRVCGFSSLIHRTGAGAARVAAAPARPGRCGALWRARGVGGKHR
jgi:tetratricopeptide (TPR) repeat protein